MSANENSPPVEAAAAAAAAAASTPRSRLPRWTRHETLVLIQARRAMERGGLQLPAVRPRPKWAAVSAYCRRHGVERGPMQCRKRWGNLSWDLKKIVAWEGKAVAGAGVGAAGDAQHESFWDMRGDQRRARQLPSSFDREVYDALVCGASAGGGVAAAVMPPDFGDGDLEGVYPQPPIMVMPISVTESDQKKAGAAAAASDKNSTSSHHGGGGGGGFKDSDATFVADQAEGTATATPPAAATAKASIEKQVIEALERGNRALAQQLEAHRSMWDADREQRAALLRAMDRVADAVCRIADKL
ncbi:hypothetical protein SORBI_3003G411500 [Sorghum bicolor]|uniref:Myb-like domain-containing protein n=1 Tax=Sorghum bicolor TaxID=4558 RepID=A0A1W0W170_SORBI|nr:hypothetical protein SORBI_3003G411500 [Sorghum bicolor]